MFNHAIVLLPIILAAAVAALGAGAADAVEAGKIIFFAFAMAAITVITGFALSLMSRK